MPERNWPSWSTGLRRSADEIERVVDLSAADENRTRWRRGRSARWRKGRTAPPVPTTRVVPLIRCADLRCTQVIEARFALTGKVCAHSRYRRKDCLVHQ